jgi:hypothetical protein
VAVSTAWSLGCPPAVRRRGAPALQWRTLNCALPWLAKARSKAIMWNISKRMNSGLQQLRPLRSQSSTMMEYPSYIAVVATVPFPAQGQGHLNQLLTRRCCSRHWRSRELRHAGATPVRGPAHACTARTGLCSTSQRTRPLFYTRFQNHVETTMIYCSHESIHEISPVRFPKSTVRTDALVWIQNCCIIVVEIYLY